MNDLRRLLSYAKPHAGALALGILLTSVVGLFEAARIALVAPIFDGLASQKVPSSLSIFDIRAYVDYYVARAEHLTPELDLGLGILAV